MDQCGNWHRYEFLGMVWVPVDIDFICTLGSLDVVPGESSTRTLFLRVMDTFLILILILDFTFLSVSYLRSRNSFAKKKSSYFIILYVLVYIYIYISMLTHPSQKRAWWWLNPTKHVKEPTDILYQNKNNTQQKSNGNNNIRGVHASTHRIHPLSHTLSVNTISAPRPIKMSPP